MRNYNFTVFLIALLLFFFSTYLKAEKSYTLYYKYREGEVANYTLRITGKGVSTIEEVEFPYKIDVNIPLKVEVTDVTEDGVIASKIMLTDIILDFQPKIPITIPEEFKTISYTSVFTKYGRVIKTIGLAEFQPKTDAEIVVRLLAEAASISTLILPEKPIKVGDTWQQEIIKEPHLPIKLKYKFEKIEKVKGVECVVIKVDSFSFPFTTLNIVEGGDYNPVRGVAEGDLTFYFSLKKGEVIKMVMPGKFKYYALLTDKSGEKFRIRVLEINFEGEAVLEKR